MSNDNNENAKKSKGKAAKSEQKNEAAAPTPAPAAPAKPKVPAPQGEKLSDKIPGEHAQEFLLGPRAVKNVSNTPILYDRFSYTHEFCNLSVTCDRFHEKASGKVVGTVPRIALQTVWEKAERWYNTHSDARKGLDITYNEWKTDYEKLTKYFERQNPDTDSIILGIITVQAVLNIPEIIFEELFLTKADQLVALINAAILYEVEEIRRLNKRWRRIKKYKYRVALAETDGGIFTASEVSILNGAGIRRLNDLRKKDIYLLKHLLPHRDFAPFIEEVNAAFKEDYEKRKDKRFKVYPFLIGFLALAGVAYLSFTYKYLLIKDAAENTPYINGLSSLWVAGLLVMFYGILRAVRRRRGKAPYYRYFTRKVRRATRWLAVASLVILGATAIFYQRYDGYNDIYYYRDLEEGAISVAGLKDETVTQFDIPRHIDGKTVVKIDTAAFYKDGAVYATIPATVEKIEPYAFYKCTSLRYLEQSVDDSAAGVKEIGKSAFGKCAELAYVDCTDTATAIGDKAFAECAALLDVDFSQTETIGEKAFFRCKSFLNINILPVTQEIGKNAFGGCTSIESITLPFIGKNRDSSDKQSLNYIIDCDSHTGGDTFTVVITDISFIHGSAFNDCDSVGKIVLPEYVTEIEAGAFDGAKGLVSVNIPAGITVLHKNLFKDCLSLSEIVGGEDVTTVEEGAFSGCSALTYVSFPQLTTVETEAFFGCTSLQFFDMPMLTAIGESAFGECSSLIGTGEHPNLQTVGNAAFENCSMLSEIDLSTCRPDGIGEAAMRYCYSLEIVSLPTGMVSIPSSLFDNCNALSYFTFDSSVTVIGDKAFRSTNLFELVLPEALTEIGEEAFSDCYQIDTLLIPDSVTKIGKHAFADCNGIYSVTLPFVGESLESEKAGLTYTFGDGVGINHITITKMTTITSQTLRAGKYHLMTVSLPSATELKKNAFKGFTNLLAVDFTSAMTEIGANAFKNCDAMTTFDIADTQVTKIGNNALANCGQLEYVSLPGTLEKIPNSLFRNCIFLENVYLGEGIKELGDEVFYGCERLNALYIPNSVEKIGKALARNCYQLSELVLSSSLEKIPKNAFRNCNSLLSVYVPASVKTIDDRAFYKCMSLNELTLVSGLEKIGKKAFYKCTSLYDVSIPSTVTKMERSILRGCENLENLTLPFVGPSVKRAKRISYITNSRMLNEITVTGAERIAKRAFRNAQNLETLTLNEGITVIGEGVVDNCYSLYYVYLPHSLSSYEGYFFGAEVVYFDYNYSE